MGHDGTKDSHDTHGVGYKQARMPSPSTDAKCQSACFQLLGSPATNITIRAPFVGLAQGTLNRNKGKGHHGAAKAVVASRYGSGGPPLQSE